MTHIAIHGSNVQLFLLCKTDSAILAEKLNLTDPETDLSSLTLMGGDSNTKPLVNLLFLIMTAVPFISYAIIIYCWKKIVQYLRNHQTFISKLISDGQIRLIRSMRIQAFLPLICLIPVIIITVISLNSSWKSPIQVYTNTVAQLWITILDPLITVWSVVPYRNAILIWLKMKKVAAVVPFVASSETGHTFDPHHLGPRGSIISTAPRHLT